MHAGDDSAAAAAEADPKRPWMEVLDADARIFMFHNFLSEEEADHIVSVSGRDGQEGGLCGRGNGAVQHCDVLHMPPHD